MFIVIPLHVSFVMYKKADMVADLENIFRSLI
jgi:hypothetical protein